MNSDQKSTAVRSPALSDGEIVSYICNNMYAQYYRYGTVHTGSCDAFPELKWAHSGRPVCNYLIGANFRPEHARDRVAHVTEMIRGHCVNALWQIGPEAIPSDIFDLAAHFGWTPIPSCTGMAIKLDGTVPDASLPDGLTISTADDEESLRTWARVYYSAAPDEFKEAVADIISELGCGPHLPWTNYIGYINGKAVASSMVFIGAGVAGLYYIGTLPDYRNRGIGTAMTIYSLKQAQSQGHDLVVLQATDMGANIYRHTGFKEYCKIRMSILKA